MVFCCDIAHHVNLTVLHQIALIFKMEVDWANRGSTMWYYVGVGHMTNQFSWPICADLSAQWILWITEASVPNRRQGHSFIPKHAVAKANVRKQQWKTATD